MLTPIQLTATEFLRQPTPAPIPVITDATALPTDSEIVVGIHDLCEGGLHLTSVTSTTKALSCWKCAFRIIVSSVGLITYGDLRAATPVNLTANAVGYTPGTPGNWAAPPPTSVQQALDRMAALLVVLNGGVPIP